MKFMLSFRLEHLNEIHQVLVLQMLEERPVNADGPKASPHFQHANFAHGDASDRGIVVRLDELLNCHSFSIILIATFEHLT